MMISAFDSLKAMNEEVCCESMIEEKALSLSDVFLNIIVKKMKIV